MILEPWVWDDWLKSYIYVLGAITQHGHSSTKKYFAYPYQTNYLSQNYEIVPFDTIHDAKKYLIEWNPKVSNFVELLGKSKGVWLC